MAVRSSCLLETRKRCTGISAIRRLLRIGGDLEYEKNKGQCEAA